MGHAAVKRLLLVPGVMALAGVLAGCAASPWETAYEGVRPERAAGPSAAARDAVLVRTVPWERLDEARRNIESRIIASDTHPDEWPAEKRAELKAILLRGLQVSEPPESIEILGRSEFSSTDEIRPGDGSLAAFAAALGATRVVWSSRYLGKADKIVSEPVWTHSTGTDYDRRTSAGRRRGSTFSYSDTSTAWVPVVVRADQTAWTAYFLREIR